MGGVQHQLLVFDTRGEREKGIEACPGFDVSVSSLNWSAKAPLLSFYAREAGKDWADAPYRAHDGGLGWQRDIALTSLATLGCRGGVGKERASAVCGGGHVEFGDSTGHDGKHTTVRRDQ